MLRQQKLQQQPMSGYSSQQQLDPHMQYVQYSSGGMKDAKYL